MIGTLPQLFALGVLILLIVSSVFDYRHHETHILPWLVVAGIGIVILGSTISEAHMTLSVSLFFLAIMILPLVVISVVMKLQKFQLGDILALVSIGLAIPTSPFILSPLTYTGISVYLNALLLWLPLAFSKRFKHLPFLPFMCVGFFIALLGDPHISVLLGVLNAGRLYNL
jgi:hypothetical protein